MGLGWVTSRARCRTEQLRPHGRDSVCTLCGRTEKCALEFLASSPSCTPCPQASLNRTLVTQRWRLLFNCALVMFNPPVLSVCSRPRWLVPRSLGTSRIQLHPSSRSLSVLGSVGISSPWDLPAPDFSSCHLPFTLYDVFSDANLIIALNHISPVFRLESGLGEASEFPDLNLESSLGWSPSPCTASPSSSPAHDPASLPWRQPGSHQPRLSSAPGHVPLDPLPSSPGL